MNSRLDKNKSILITNPYKYLSEEITFEKRGNKLNKL